jgi:hypothetical protein
MNPFAQLVRVDAPLPPPKAPSDDATDTATLRRLLHGRGPLTTAALADATGLALYRVRNLLGRGKASGRVFWDGRHWSINHQYLGVDVLRAAALLRAQGWRVSAPSALDMAQPDIGSGAKCAPAESNPWGLSAGQIRVMNAVLAQGINKNAARALGCSTKTIETVISITKVRMGCTNRVAQMVLWDRWLRKTNTHHGDIQ